MSAATDIKDRIKVLLDALVTDGVLALAIEDPLKMDFGYNDIGLFPAAILSTPSVGDSEYHTNRDNARVYEFNIVIVMKAEDVGTLSTVLTLQDAIMDKFDNDPTLAGAAHGGASPATNAPAPVATADGSFITFFVTIRAKAIIDLTF